MQSCELTNWKVDSYIDTLAAADGEAGNFEEAVRQQERAIALLPKANDAYEKRVVLYRAGQRISRELVGAAIQTEHGPLWRLRPRLEFSPANVS